MMATTTETGSDRVQQARERLWASAMAGDPMGVQEALEAGASPNADTSDGRGALHLAAIDDHLEIVELLLARGAAVAMQDFDGMTPIELAVAADHRRIVACLLPLVGSEGAALAVSTALRHRNLDLAEWLFGRIAGSEPRGNPPPDYSRRISICHQAIEVGTPGLLDSMTKVRVHPTLLLFLAAGEGRIDLIEHLMKNGETGRTPVSTCWEKLDSFNGEHIVDAKGRILCEVDHHIEEDFPGWVNSYIADTLPIHFAAACGQVAVVQWFVQHGFHHDTRSRRTDRSPLFYAVENSQIETVRWLLDVRADPHLCDSNGVTPALVALWLDNPELLSLFRERGVTISDTDKAYLRGPWRSRFQELLFIQTRAASRSSAALDAGATSALGEAIQAGDPVLARRCLNAGADPNGLVSHRGFISLAISGKQSAIARLLIAHGASLDDPDSLYGGNTLVNQALHRGLPEVAEILLQRGVDPGQPNAKGETPLHTRLKWLSPSDLRMILRAGVDPNQRDRNGRTPLFMAALEGTVESIRILMEAGADHTIGDPLGQTPLLTAIAARRTEVARALLEAGADPNVIGNKGRAALHWAVTRDDSAIIEALLDKKAFPELCDEDGRTALLLAIESKSSKSATMLIEKGAKCEVAGQDGKTALYQAIEKGLDPVAKKLFQGGADPRRAVGAGKTPLDLAVRKQRRELVRLFGGSLDAPPADTSPEVDPKGSSEPLSGWLQKLREKIGL